MKNCHPQRVFQTNVLWDIQACKDSLAFAKILLNIGKLIMLEGKNIVKDKTIAIRILVSGHDQYFVSLKDYKPNFMNSPKTRLINPAKNNQQIKQIHL